MMSDSDNDLLPNNVYTFQNESTRFCAKGPNINSNNISSLSFRNNAMTTMPRNFERQRYREQCFDQRSMYYRREKSPMSVYSCSDMRPTSFHNSLHPGGMRSHMSMYNGRSGSVYNGRSGSPMSMRSMRSIDSNTTVSAADIASAFKNVNFNKYDLRIIKEAYNKLMKKKVRKRIEKRRNMRLFLKGCRRKSGYDSGELGSDSSISSDDCRSTHSVMYKNNISSSRSTKTDITELRSNIKESNMYQDCTDNLKSVAIQNIFSVPRSTGQTKLAITDSNISKPQKIFTQKERFKNGFLLPSQRFNKSVASIPIPERGKSQQNIQNNDLPVNQQRNIVEMDSDQEEIFSEVTVRENTTNNISGSQHDSKRCLDIEDRICPNNKRTKLSSPIKPKNSTNNSNSKSTTVKNNKIPKIANKKRDDFEFLKPQFPVRKCGTAKVKEKLISKSAPSITDAIMLSDKIVKETAAPTNPKDVEPPSKISPVIDSTVNEHLVNGNSSNDTSMRPSFIKRKLFTQKMDVADNKNISSEALNINSPHTNLYSAIQREKHKARKLVTNQSCLNRDIIQDDNNLLDLIHKIVPPEHMNVTHSINKTSLMSKASQNDKNLDENQWDVSSIISNHINDDVSDTYTDEEIFNEKVKKISKKGIKIVANKMQKPVTEVKNMSKCSIVLEKLPEKVVVANKTVTKPLVPKNTFVADQTKKSVSSCIKSFWDTDFESDLEGATPKRCPTELKENLNISDSSKKLKNSLSNKTAISQMNKTGIGSSESVVSKFMTSMSEKNMIGLKKYNINRNLTIKAFRTPKQKNKVEKPEAAKDIEVDRKRETRSRNQNAESEKSSEEIHKKINKCNNIKKSSLIKTHKGENNKTNNSTKSKDTDSAHKKANVSVNTRSVRRPKINICCNEHPKNNVVSKVEDPKANSKKPETSDKKTNKTITKPKQQPNRSLRSQCLTESFNSNKQNESINDHEKADDSEQMSRSLRTRKINLSSSLNTSCENITNITTRSLRNRRINLSSSGNNSTLETNLTMMNRNTKKSPNAHLKSNTRKDVKTRVAKIIK